MPKLFKLTVTVIMIRVRVRQVQVFGGCAQMPLFLNLSPRPVTQAELSDLKARVLRGPVLVEFEWTALAWSNAGGGGQTHAQAAGAERPRRH